MKTLLLAVAILGLWSGGALAQEAPATASPAASSAPVEVAAPVEAAAPAEPDREWLRELRSSEATVHALKEEVFRSKATLQLLRELAVQGASGSGGLRIRHQTALARVYRVVGVDYFLDGKSVYAWKATEGGEPHPREVVVRDGAATPGQHNVQVSVQLQGEGGGMFAYVEAYQTKVDSTAAFDVQGGLVTDVTVKIQTKAKGKKSFTERPNIVYEERRETLKAE